MDIVRKRWKGPAFFCVDPLGLLRDGVKGQTRRTSIARLVQSSTSYAEALEKDPDTVATGRGVVLDLFRLKEARVHRNEPRTCIWIYGASGTGKSALARALAEKYAADNYFIHPTGSLKWWDGYIDQPVVIINDFRRDQCQGIGGFSYLLNILDRYDVHVEVKGQITRGLWDVCIITSPVPPDVAWTYRKQDGGSEMEEHISQLIRRLTHIIELRVLDGVTYDFDRTADFRSKFGAADTTGQPLQRSAVFDLPVMGGE